MKDGEIPAPATGAEAVLTGLARAGVSRLFANAGTDFPPIIEALAALPPGARPEPVTVPHETAAVAMAHGYYLVTGEPQAVMVHVNVGLANAAMGMINAASDNIPLVMMSGRTPLTETGRKGGRVSPIQYGQEMYDQAALVREAAKFDYEMRYPEQGEAMASRAVALATSAPEGPVYLSLPREPLMAAPAPEGRPGFDGPRPAATPAHPDPAAIRAAAEWLAAARAPVILCQRGDVAGRLGAALAELAGRHGVGVVEPFVIRNVMAGDHPAYLGNDPGPAIAAADLVIVLDSGVPWIEKLHAPGQGTRVIHIGPDPHFTRMPMRGFRTDLAIAADPAVAVAALDRALPGPDAAVEARRADLAARAAARRERMAEIAAAGDGAPPTGEFLSRCLSDALDETAVVFSELGVVPGAMTLKGPNRLFNTTHSGGLGWAFPAALGAQLADRDRLCVAAMGDGSYIFANPAACHQIAEALELPVLIVVKNNAMWNAVRRAVVGAYPDGAAARANLMPLTSLAPQPDFTLYARASRAHAERVTTGAELPGALERALNVIRTERRAALLDVAVAVSDSH